MLIFIPMAGFGDRYIRAGFTEPKPLIPVDGKPMIERVVDAFREALAAKGKKKGEVKFLFCVNAKHAAETSVKETLARIAPGAPVVVIDPHKDGPVRTLLDCAEHIPDDEEVILNYCDFGVDWTFADFRAWLAKGKWDGAMTGYKGFHPHSLGPTLYAYMRSDGDKVTEIREKHHFTENKLEEYASSGLYYFKSGKEMKRLSRALVEKGERVNGEFYVSMLMQLLIEGGGKVGVYPLKHFYQWGTPEDLRDFESWLRGIRRFRSFAAEAAEGPTDAVQVIPMAGRGQRFVDQGYADPKPLIPVGGKAMIVRSLECLPPPRQRVLVVQREHQESARFREVAASLRGKIVALDKVTRGQACTARIGVENVEVTGGVDMQTPILFAPCDTGYVYDVDKWLALEKADDCDLILFTAKNHLPALWRPQMYGWLSTTKDGLIDKVAVKKQVEGVLPAEQEVVTGTFWFKSARLYQEETDAMIAANDRVNNEFYIDTIARRMVERGARVRAFTVDKYMPWGTPEELKTFLYWNEVFRGGRAIERPKT
jgi:NDP-sugar pyrophosphorylase family protein